MKLGDISAETFLEEELPLKYLAQIPRACKNAYMAVAQLQEEVPFLRIPSAEYGIGYMRSWAVEFEVEKLIKEGSWPFEYSWQFYDKPTGKYLGIKTPNAFLTISQIQNESDFPRNANFRNNQAFNNQTFLSFFQPSVCRPSDCPTLILAHGYQEFSFAFVGMPHPEEKAWLYRTGNIVKQIHDASTHLPVVETVEETVVTLKENLKRRLNDAAS